MAVRTTEARAGATGHVRRGLSCRGLQGGARRAPRRIVPRVPGWRPGHPGRISCEIEPNPRAPHARSALPPRHPPTPDTHPVQSSRPHAAADRAVVVRDARRMSDVDGQAAGYRPTLLTDSNDPAVEEAAVLLGGWGVVQRADRDLAAGLGAAPDARAVVVTTDNPNALRDVFAEARRAGIPVVVGCADETMRRRAAELRADDWYRIPGDADEIAARVRTAIARAQPNGSALSDRIERAEYEHMLYDARTGLPTLPVAIERSRALIKERGEVVVLYLNFVRYSKLEEIYGWEKLDAVLETTAERGPRDPHGIGALGLARARVVHERRGPRAAARPDGRRAAWRPRPRSRSWRAAWRRTSAQRLEAAHGEDVARAVRHLRRRRARVLQPEDAARAPGLSRHPRGGAGGQERGGARARAQGRGPAREPARPAGVRRLPPDRRGGVATHLRLRGARARRACARCAARR